MLRGEQRWIGSAGTQDLEGALPMPADAVFRAGSITKVFTGALVMQAIGAGAFELEEPLSRWQPEFPNAGAITIEQLLFVRRAGAQAQVSEQQRIAEVEHGGVRDLVTWLVAHPGDELTVPALARRAGMSVRNFARLFRAQTGSTPARYVAQVRLEAARRMLETSGKSMDEIAAACGLATASALRRLFGRRVGATPRQYRERVTR